MKKLTSSIFIGILGLYAAGAANAAVVSTGYLEEKLADKQDAFTVGGNVKMENNVLTVDTGAVGADVTTLVTGGAVDTAIKAAVSAEVTARDEAIESAISDEVTARNNAISAKIGDLGENADVVAAIASSLGVAKGYTDQEINALAAKLDGTAGPEGQPGLVTQVTNLQQLVGGTAVADQIANAIDALTAEDIPELGISKITGLQDALDAKQTKLGVDDFGNFVTIDENGKIVTTFKPTESVAIANDGSLSVGVITNANIVDGSIDGKKLAANSVTGDQIANGAIGADELGENAVTDAAVADGALGVAKINGLQDSLNAKFEVPAYTTQTQNGTYVLTATQTDAGVTYAWENIAGRDDSVTE